MNGLAPVHRRRSVLLRALAVLAATSLLGAAVVGGRELLRPAAVTFLDPSVTVLPGEHATVRVQTSGGRPFADALHWRISPSSLGTIDARGVFRAGATTGSGKLTASFAGAAASIPVKITCPGQIQVAGIQMSAACGEYADVYVDVATTGGPTLARAAVDKDTVQVARDLQMSIERRFRVYYFATRTNMVAGLLELDRGFTIDPSSYEAGALYIDRIDAIAIDQSDSPANAAGVLRHELVHRFVRQYVGLARVDEIPPWLNEGWATVEEMPVTGWLRTEARLVAASMAHVGKLPSLNQMSDLTQWNDRRGIAGLYQYYAAAQATSFLLDDVKVSGVLRILKAVRDGEAFADAFARAGSSADYSSFARDFPGRVTALVTTYPGITVASGSMYGAGNTVIAYGLSPGAVGTLSFAGPRQDEESVRVDAFGVVLWHLTPEWPAGRYDVTLELTGTRLTVPFAR